MGILEVTILIVILGLLFDYTNGFHDAANVVSTMIATRALAPIAAIVLAGVLNTIGATQVSGVAHTIATGIVQHEAATQEMVLYALIGAILWNFITWYFRIPTSSSYALIGGMMGISLFEGGACTILWKGVTERVLIPMVVSPFIGFGIAYVLMKLIYFFSTYRRNEKADQIYRYLQIGSGGLVALAHGMNDAQKSMGIISLGLFASGFIPSAEIPLWVILACAITMGLGTAFGGLRIVHTVGFKITRLVPAQGFAAETSASMVILIASFLGMPISSSQMIVGSVSGVGAARGIAHVKWQLGKRLVAAWALTLPGSALFAVLARLLVCLIT